jgi:hypothetical protein
VFDEKEKTGCIASKIAVQPSLLRPGKDYTTYANRFLIL